MQSIILFLFLALWETLCRYEGHLNRDFLVFLELHKKLISSVPKLPSNSKSKFLYLNINQLEVFR